MPDVVNKNATVAPWITISVQQDGNGLLSFKNASAVETYVRETTTYPPAPAPKPVADEGKKEGGKTADGKTEDAPSAEAEAAPADDEAPADGSAVFANDKNKDQGAGTGEAEAAPADAEAEAAAPGAEAAPDPAPAEPAAAPEPVVKKTRKFRDVNVPMSVEVMGQLSAKAVMECEEAECKMAQQDRLIWETEVARNDLETFVYSTRDMLDIALADYVSEEEKASMKGDLQSEEDWLYSDEGYDADKKTFVARLSALQKKGSVFTTREAEANGREAACKQLTDTIRKYRDIVDSVNTKDQERYEHLTDEQRQQVREKCDAAQGWLAENREAQKALPLSVDPVLTIKLCKEQRKEVIGVCKPIVNTPKPQPPKEEPKAPEAAADGDASAAAAAAAAAPAGKEGDAAAAPEESGASKEGAEAPAAEAEAPAAAAGKEGEIPEGMPADTTFD